MTRDGHAIGSLCVIDTVPRQPTQGQLDALKVLALGVIAQMELRQSAENLRESEELNHPIVKTALDAVIAVNSELRVTAWNPRAQRIFGLPESEARGQLIEQLLMPPNAPAGDIACFLGLFAKDRDIRHDEHVEMQLKRRGGTPFPAELCAAPLQTRDSWRFSVFVRDVSERKLQESQRREAATRDVAIFTMAHLAESRDPETGTHIERVQSYCKALAEQLAAAGRHESLIDPEFIQLIYTTSPLHDIGKVGIPDAILLKRGPLSKAEFEIMKSHASIGAATLDAAMARFPNTRFLKMARNIAATHHERFDGTGYPNGLEEQDIPLCGRIVALADVYDALTTRRAYKAAFTHADAKGIIVKESGKQFDPAIVEAFLAIEDKFESIRKRFAECLEVAA